MPKTYPNYRFEILEMRLHLAATLVRDITANGVDPRSATSVGDYLYFSASDKKAGEEIWRSDGTVAGTARVADLVKGTANSSPRDLTNIDGVLYFTANYS